MKVTESPANVTASLHSTLEAAKVGYTITYTHAFNKTSEQWTRSFSDAKKEVIRCVATGVADYVEIRDSCGKLAYRYPVRMRPPVMVIDAFT